MDELKEFVEQVMEAIENKLDDPQYQHEGENWEVGLYMAESIIENLYHKTQMNREL